MIQAENLTKFFGQSQAINNVSFSAAKGEVLGFLGPNGAGKTTTMRILSCFMPPTSGKARIAGYCIRDDSLEVRKRLGYMPENTPLYTYMTTRSYLYFVAEVKGIPATERKRKVDHVIGDCGLQSVSGRIIGVLSKGFRQRVGIAQALIGKPKVLILDEPTAGLDPKQIIEIRDLIKSLAKDRTIILSTHILPEVSMVCDRVIIINDGAIIAVDTPQNLMGQLQKNTRTFIKVEGPKQKVSEQLQNVAGVVRVSDQESSNDSVFSFILESGGSRDIEKSVAQKIVENGWGLLEMTPLKMTLEDIFIKLVTRESE
jgi:ABC-2 type transport system ATP-binding protein